MAVGSGSAVCCGRMASGVGMGVGAAAGKGAGVGTVLGVAVGVCIGVGVGGIGVGVGSMVDVGVGVIVGMNVGGVVTASRCRVSVGAAGVRLTLPGFSHARTSDITIMPKDDSTHERFKSLVMNLGLITFISTTGAWFCRQ